MLVTVMKQFFQTFQNFTALLTNGTDSESYSYVIGTLLAQFIVAALAFFFVKKGAVLRKSSKITS